MLFEKKETYLMFLQGQYVSFYSAFWYCVEIFLRQLEITLFLSLVMLACFPDCISKSIFRMIV